jgi:hypothetical protein
MPLLLILVGDYTFEAGGKNKVLKQTRELLKLLS